jgi:signal transduction histidine kinase
MFGLELAFGKAPRWLFALSISLPVAWLIFTDNAAVAPLFLLLVVAWTVATGDQRDAVIAVVLATIAVLGYIRFDTPDRWLPWIAGIVTTGLMMRLLVVQQRLVRELRAAQADLAHQAVANERRRIAGEIHDIAAHALAVTVLHLTGARMRLQRESADPELVESLAQAERLARQSLDDVRRTVGLLREDSTSTAPPLPGAADIRQLVADYQTAGLEVDLEMNSVDDESVAPATGLALYRIVQESLANAVKHAPGAGVHVRVDLDSGAHLQVRNRLTSSPSANGSSGHGLEGMRERARLLGGWLRAGPSDGAWLVECGIPNPDRIVHDSSSAG